MFEELEKLNLENVYLEKEWVISIQTPESGISIGIGATLMKFTENP